MCQSLICDNVIPGGFKCKVISMGVLTVDEAIEKSGCGLSQVIYVGASSGIFFLELLSLVSDGIILPIIKCEWNLTGWQASGYLLSTRMAFCVGGAVGGLFGDRIGRRRSILMGLLFQIIMTTIALNCYSVLWYVFFHALKNVAFGIIMPSAGALALESCPAAKRFLVKVVFGYSGCAGAVFGAFIGRYYESYGWRNIQLLVTFPCYLAFFAFLFLDSSPRHLLVKGKQKEAEEIVKKFLRRNGKLVENQFFLVKEGDIKETCGSYRDLFRHGLARHSYKLMFMIFMKGVFASTFYITMPYLLGTKTKDEGETLNHPENCYSVNSRAQSKLVTAFLPDLLINPGLLLVAQCYGRRKAISMAFFLASVSLFTSSFVSFGLSAFSLAIGTALATIAAGRGVIMLYTSELYPTTLRGVATGMIWVTDNIGSFTSPFLAEFVILSAPRLFICLAAVGMGAAALIARTLDTETLNRPLAASIADMPAKRQVLTI